MSAEWQCPTCKALGFVPSVLGPTRCTFCDGTEGGNPPTPEEIAAFQAGTAASAIRKPLGPDELLRLGALSLQYEQAEAIDRLLDAQREHYEDKALSRADLVQALLDRDRQLARTGREIASGRTAGKLLREFVRGILYTADHAALRRVGDATKAGQIEGILKALGAEPADLRTLRLAGTTLGTGPDMEKVAEELASGQRKVGTTASKGIDILRPNDPDRSQR